VEGPVKKRGFPFRKKEPEETPEAREAREAAQREAERLEAERAARLAAIGETWAHVSERVRAVLPSSSDPRQAYFLSLARQGREAEEQGRSGVAAHCGACIEKGLDERTAILESQRAASSASPRPSAQPSALQNLKARWDEAARKRAEALLQRHAASLAPAEREAYAAAFEALSSSPGKTAQPLRRKLIDRLTRASAYRRRAQRLSGWTASPPPETGPAGPYNDFAALEDMVRRVAASHPEWAAEFLDLYGNMGALRKAYGELLPKSKS
jgi:hypothetical protein